MNITKKNFAKIISTENDIPFDISSDMVSSFFNIQKKIINSSNLKISKFGSYKSNLTPQRIGRNPKTLKEYIIPAKKKISFKASKHIKKILN